jgi:hypothetical protein
MEVTRNVILDLMPLYLAGEASPETKALVEEYLKKDPKLARLAEKSAVELPKDIPVTLTQEDKMKAYVEMKRLAFKKQMFFAGMMLASFLVLLLAYMMVFR